MTQTGLSLFKTYCLAKGPVLTVHTLLLLPRQPLLMLSICTEPRVALLGTPTDRP